MLQPDAHMCCCNVPRALAHCVTPLLHPPASPLPSELKLTSYSFESCVAAVLQLRVPHVPQAQLHAWFAGGPGAGRWRCLAYWARRARLNLALLDQLDLVGRTGEMARTFGIDFYSGAAECCWVLLGAGDVRLQEGRCVETARREVCCSVCRQGSWVPPCCVSVLVRLTPSLTPTSVPQCWRVAASTGWRA